jgi:3-dehydroquinate dehydratase-2
VTTVYVLNGPNLGRLGTREPDVYGSTSYADLVSLCEASGDELGLKVVVRQTDAEHEMLAWLHAAADEQAPVVSAVATGVIAGLGIDGYRLALTFIAR